MRFTCPSAMRGMTGSLREPGSEHGFGELARYSVPPMSTLYASQTRSAPFCRWRMTVPMSRCRSSRARSSGHSGLADRRRLEAIEHLPDLLADLGVLVLQAAHRAVEPGRPRDDLLVEPARLLGHEHVLVERVADADHLLGDERGPLRGCAPRPAMRSRPRGARARRAGWPAGARASEAPGSARRLVLGHPATLDERCATGQIARMAGFLLARRPLRPRRADVNPTRVSGPYPWEGPSEGSVQWRCDGSAWCSCWWPSW